MSDNEKGKSSNASIQEDLAQARNVRKDMQKRFIPSMWTAPQSLSPPANPAHQPSKSRSAAYFRRVALPHDLNGPMPTRGQRIANLAGGIIGAATCVYLILFHDFGDRDHVFSPIRRFLRMEEFNPMIMTEEEKNWAKQKRFGAQKENAKLV